MLRKISRKYNGGNLQQQWKLENKPQVFHWLEILCARIMVNAAWIKELLTSHWPRRDVLSYRKYADISAPELQRVNWETDLATPRGPSWVILCVRVLSSAWLFASPWTVIRISRNPVSCRGARPGKPEEEREQKMCHNDDSCDFGSALQWLPWWNRELGCQDLWIWNHSILILSGRFCGLGSEWDWSKERQLLLHMEESWVSPNLTPAPKSFCKQRGKQAEVK